MLTKLKDDSAYVHICNPQLETIFQKKLASTMTGIDNRAPA